MSVGAQFQRYPTWVNATNLARDSGETGYQNVVNLLLPKTELESKLFRFFIRENVAPMTRSVPLQRHECKFLGRKRERLLTNYSESSFSLAFVATA